MKVAVIGVGGNGEQKVRTLKASGLVSDLVVMDVDAGRLKQVAGEHGVKATTRFDEVLGDPAVRLVCIATPNDTHAKLTIAALAAGKAVLCEKPMANTLDDARAMVAAAERHHGWLEIGFELRHSNLYTQARQWIDQGLLGDVVNTHCYYVSSEYLGRASWRVKKDICGDMFGEKLSHYVDLPRWWIGQPVTEVFAVCAPNVVPYYEVRDNYQVTYRFANGAVSHLTFMMAPAATFRGDPLQDVLAQQVGDGHALRYFLQGTRGAAELDVFERRIQRWSFGEDDHGFTSTVEETLSWDAADDQTYFHNTAGHALEAVRRVAANLPPSTPAGDALETTRLCFAVEESVRTGCPVKL